MARTGKIASLPFEIQRQVNLRLLNNQRGETLLAWLNELAEVRAVLDACFEGEEVTHSNLTNWRQGGYQDFLKERAEVERMRALSSHLADVAEAGGSVYAGLSTVLGEKLSMLFSSWTPEQQQELLSSPKSLIGLLSAAASLQTSQTGEKKLAIDQKKLAQKERELAQRERDQDRREREFQWKTAELFVAHAKRPEIQAILTSGRPKTAILPDLIAELFPDPGTRN